MKSLGKECVMNPCVGAAESRDRLPRSSSSFFFTHFLLSLSSGLFDSSGGHLFPCLFDFIPTAMRVIKYLIYIMRTLCLDDSHLSEFWLYHLHLFFLRYDQK